MKGEAFKLKLEYGHSDYIAVLIINHQQIAMLDFHFWSSQMQVYTTTHIHLKGRGPVRML